MQPLNWPLIPVSMLYAGIMRVRNARYERAGAAQRAAVPVISVGNITVGGTGKTPLVIELVRRLQSWGRRPAILTRGYKGSPDAAADEVLEFGAAVPQAPVVVDANRVNGAATAVRTHHADCVVLDDGFQHRRLARDLDLVLIDALQPWGGGWVLPAGRLREPLSGLCRADWIILTRSNLVDDAVRQSILNTLATLAPRVPVTGASVEIDRVAMGDQHTSANVLHSATAIAACGIGNPTGFRRLLDATGLNVVRLNTYPDHYRFAVRDVESLRRQAQDIGSDLVVVTRKDWTKLGPLWQAAGDHAGVRLARIEVRTVLHDPAGTFDARLRATVPDRGP